MKKAFIVIVLALLAATGCKQPQEPKAPAGYTGGIPMKSPEEMRQLEDMAKQAPKNGDVWIALGNAYMDSKRYNEAVDAYQKALVIYPKNVDVRVDRGTCLKNSGRPALALQEYKQAIKINPSHLYAHRNMGIVLAFDLKDTKGAIKEFEKYLELSPTAHDAADIQQMIQNMKGGK